MLQKRAKKDPAEKKIGQIARDEHNVEPAKFLPTDSSAGSGKGKWASFQWWSTFHGSTFRKFLIEHVLVSFYIVRIMIPPHCKQNWRHSFVLIFLSPFFTGALEAKETWRGAVCSIRTTLSLSAVPSFHNCPQIWKISTINWTLAHWLANKQGVNHPDNDLTTPCVVFLWTHIFPAKLDQTEKAFRLF